MIPTLAGIHHVTAIAGSAQDNVTFYTKVLGMRLIKKTVNFDDNFTYHLYFGDNTGNPGTAMTFFPWQYAQRGRNGRGLTKATTYRIPDGALDFWKSRLHASGVAVAEVSRFGNPVLQFEDTDGTLLELEQASVLPALDPVLSTQIPVDKALFGFAGVTLNAIAPDATQRFLEDVMGFSVIATENERTRFAPTGNPAESWVDVIETRDEAGKLGRGMVHHVAFRVKTDEEQLAWIEYLSKRGVRVTGVKDRQYFHSIYFQEPGGVLFEIATDGPGFMADEDVETLGTALKLPSWIEPRRAEIEAALPPLS